MRAVKQSRSAKQRRSSLRLQQLESRRLLTSDFGDAPAPYPTLLAENGASHFVAGPSLGMQVDQEADGVHSDLADADNADDGVTFGALRVGALDQLVTVNVHGGAAHVSAWIDFDNDGNWLSAGEQILFNTPVSEGDNLLEIDVPAWAVSGNTFARFRLSTAGIQSPFGAASDGEVEDYMVEISPPLAGNTYADPQIIGAGRSTSGGNMSTVDIDLDGVHEIISSSGNEIVWYHHNQSGTVEQNRVPTSSLVSSLSGVDLDLDGDIDFVLGGDGDDTVPTNVAWIESDGQTYVEHSLDSPFVDAVVTPTDFDSDGDLDLLAYGRSDGGEASMFWYENDGGMNFTSRFVADNVFHAVPADLDGDNDIDLAILTVDTETNEVVLQWWENDGSENFSTHELSRVLGLFFELQVVDLDGDDALDLLTLMVTQDPGNSELVWYDNSQPGEFTQRTIVPSPAPRGRIRTVDFDGDGDTDILTGSIDDGVVEWIENVGDGSYSRHRLLQGGAVAELAMADFDGDQELDLLVGSAVEHTLTWYRDSAGQGYAPTLLNTSVHLPEVVAVADLDGDGDLDVVTASYADRRLSWHENMGGGRSFRQRHLHVADRIAGLHTVDLNQDGAVDLVASVDEVLTWFENDGNANFTTRAVTQLGFDAVLETVDLDADGDLDVVGTSQGFIGGHNLVWYENNGEERFTEQSLMNSQFSTITFRPGDLDRDGDMDIFVEVDREFHWFENNGQAGFRQETLIENPRSTGLPALNDLDHDGDLDLVVAEFGIEWYENDGSLQFDHQMLSFSFPVQTLLVADGDGDEDLDFLTKDSEKLEWHWNEGGSYTVSELLRSSVPTPMPTPGPVLADLDGDGDLDVVSFWRNENSIFWLENRPSVDNLVVVDVGINASLQDPPDLPDAPQPSSWGTQRSSLQTIDLVFNEPFNVAVADLTLVNLGVNADAEPDQVVMLTTDQLLIAGERLTIDLADIALDDGVYSLTIAPTVSGVSGGELDGNGDGVAGDAFVLAGNSTNGFYQLAADFNGDESVTVFDVATFAYWFGEDADPQTGPAPTYLDLNGDGGVTIFDFATFSGNFGATVVFPQLIAAKAVGPSLLGLPEFPAEFLQTLPETNAITRNAEARIREQPSTKSSRVDLAERIQEWLDMSSEEPIAKEGEESQQIWTLVGIC